MSTAVAPTAPEDAKAAREGWLERLSRLAPGLTPARFSRRRLEAAVATLRPELERRAGRQPGAWVAEATQLLDEAARTRTSDVDRGWACFNAALRASVLGMSVPEQQAEGLVLLHEAKEKLTGWRREAVVALLDKGNVGAEVLQRAMRIRDESSDNEFRRLALGREQIGTAVLVLGLALAAFLPLELVLPVGLSLKPEAAPTRIWAFVFLFGVIGGCISVLQSGAAARGRVPLLLGHTLITAARPLTGGAAALVSYALFGAGVFGGAKVDSVAAVLGIAFAAGFSERIVIKTAQALAGDGAPADGGGSRSPKR